MSDCLTEGLPTARLAAIIDNQFVLCPNCQQKHALFYKRGKANKLSLHFNCNKVRQHWMEGETQHYKFTTRQGDVQFMPGLPIPEKWTSYRREAFQADSTPPLI